MAHRRHDVVGAVIQADGGTGSNSGSDLVGPSGHGDHTSPGGTGHLHCCRTGGSGSRLHHHGVPGFDAGPVVEGDPGGLEHHMGGHGRDVIDGVADGVQVGGAGQRVVGP